MMDISFGRLMFLLRRGWVVLAAVGLFVMSLCLYVATLSPVASFWDCGEFILCGAGLEVGHPPGAPLYMLVLRLAAVLSAVGGSVAFWCNMVSAVASALTVSVMFLICYRILGLMFGSVRRLSLVSSVIGAAVFAVSDTFWFSAVESEVYALSMLFTAVTFWLSLEWLVRRQRGERGTARYMALVVFLLGLSVGVHLLNLLVIPAVALVVAWGLGHRGLRSMAVALAIGAAVLFVAWYVVVQNGLEPAKTFELLFVNVFGLPQHSGLLFYVVAVYVFLFGAIFLTRRSGGWLHTAALWATLFVVGYSSYATVIIRANAHTGIDLGSPDNVFSFDSFINREQYGNRPFFFGPWYNSTPSGTKERLTYRADAQGKYEVYDSSVEYEYAADEQTFFPRMYSSELLHRYGYALWAGVDVDAETPPSFFAQMRYLFAYQLNFMYVRYLMWNFSGRQNDIPGDGSAVAGNWISGIPIIDSYLGDRRYPHPDEQYNVGRAMYFMLPFLFGIAGLCVVVARRGCRRMGGILLLLFLLTGPAIAVYLNQPPFEPRERDYVFVGSFMVFAVFIVIGIFMLMRLVVGRFRSMGVAALLAVALFLALPMVMLAQNLPSHDRSGRTVDTDIARACLDACPQNAVLFTAGDNDTYPLWYLQEVEEHRRDVRVINYGLFGADWCIGQARRAARQSLPVRLTIPQNRYLDGRLDYAYVMPDEQGSSDITNAVNLLATAQSDVTLDGGETLSVIPWQNLYKVSAEGDTLKIHLPSTVLYRNDIALLDIIATQWPERPVCFTPGSTDFNNLGLSDYIADKGLVQILTPDTANTDGVDLPMLFLRTLDLPSATTYKQQYDVRNNLMVMRYRDFGNRAARVAMQADDIDTAVEILYKSMAEFPVEAQPLERENIVLACLLHDVGEPEAARNVFMVLTDRYIESLLFYVAMSETDMLTAQVGMDNLRSFGQMLIDALTQTSNHDFRNTLVAYFKSLGFESDAID